jgi:hypothetical protein
VSKLQLVLGSVVATVWVVGYLMAFFVDRSLTTLASSVTPLMLIIVGALFAQSAIQIVKGGGDKKEGGSG